MAISMVGSGDSTIRRYSLCVCHIEMAPTWFLQRGYREGRVLIYVSQRDTLRVSYIDDTKKGEHYSTSGREILCAFAIETGLCVLPYRDGLCVLLNRGGSLHVTI